MSENDNDQQSQSQKALKQKAKNAQKPAPDHPPQGRTSDEGMRPVEREKPITPEEKVRD